VGSGTGWRMMRLVRIPLRARLTLAFAAGMTVVSLGVGAFVYVQVRGDLRHQVDLGLRARAQALTAGDSTGPLRFTSGHYADNDESVAQLLTPQGRVLGSTRSVAGQPLLPLRELRAGRFANTKPPRLDALRLFVAATTDHGQPAYLVVGATMSDTREELGRLALLFLVALPAALAVSSVIGWLLAGAALRPMRRMSVEAAAIGGDQPDRRMTIPRGEPAMALLASTLNSTFDRLQEAIRRERRFAGNASHELRTPLATLKAEVDTALSAPRTHDELCEALASAAGEVRHLIAITEGLLVLARDGKGGLPIARTTTSLRELVHDRVKAFTPTAEHAGVTLTAEADDVSAQLDPRRARQALDNLIANAIRHTPPGGAVSVSATVDGKGAQLVVEDDGSGFTESALAAAFEPFNRAAGEDGGAGLGLAMANAVAVAHGGSATAANRPGRGAVVTLHLGTPS
jgi:two-component system OmpR family sensor kinase